MNEDIRVREVRLIDHTGTNVGVVATTDALARRQGLDLSISPDNPPVAKILQIQISRAEEGRRGPQAESRRDQEIKIQHRRSRLRREDALHPPFLEGRGRQAR
jgi:translation initiation factor IF-3